MRKVLLLIFSLAALTSQARAENPIPSELVGVWTTETTFIWLRKDGLCSMAGPLGWNGLATYDSKTHLLTMSLRHDRTGNEVGKVTAVYDPEARTLTPREKGLDSVYKRRSKKVGEPFDSLDLKTILEPSK